MIRKILESITEDQESEKLLRGLERRGWRVVKTNIYLNSEKLDSIPENFDGFLSINRVLEGPFGHRLAIIFEEAEVRGEVDSPRMAYDTFISLRPEREDMSLFPPEQKERAKILDVGSPRFDAENIIRHVHKYADEYGIK